MNFDDGRKFSYPLEKFMKLIEIDYNMNNIVTVAGAVDQRRELKELLLHRQTLPLKKLKQGSWTYQFKIVFSYQRFIVFLVFINLFLCPLYILTICKVPNWIITGASKN